MNACAKSKRAGATPTPDAPELAQSAHHITSADRPRIRRTKGRTWRRSWSDPGAVVVMVAAAIAARVRRAITPPPKSRFRTRISGPSYALALDVILVTDAPLQSVPHFRSICNHCHFWHFAVLELDGGPCLDDDRSWPFGYV